MKRKTAHILSHIDLEALIWLSALIYLSIINPYEPKHINLCLFSLAGIENCPGCGLGRSIAMIFRGDLLGSFESHPLGIPALIFILKRVYQIIRNKTRIYKVNKKLKSKKNQHRYPEENYTKEEKELLLKLLKENDK